jgi:hypothetical protein
VRASPFYRDWTGVEAAREGSAAVVIGRPSWPPLPEEEGAMWLS